MTFVWVARFSGLYDPGEDDIVGVFENYEDAVSACKNESIGFTHRTISFEKIVDNVFEAYVFNNGHFIVERHELK